MYLAWGQVWGFSWVSVPPSLPGSVALPIPQLPHTPADYSNPEDEVDKVDCLRKRKIGATPIFSSWIHIIILLQLDNPNNYCANVDHYWHCRTSFKFEAGIPAHPPVGPVQSPLGFCEIQQGCQQLVWEPFQTHSCNSKTWRNDCNSQHSCTNTIFAFLHDCGLVLQ